MANDQDHLHSDPGVKQVLVGIEVRGDGKSVVEADDDLNDGLLENILYVSDDIQRLDKITCTINMLTGSRTTKLKQWVATDA